MLNKPHGFLSTDSEAGDNTRDVWASIGTQIYINENTAKGSSFLKN